MEIKGFITNLGKYNEGELIGKWITFPIEDETELNDILFDIQCKSVTEDDSVVYPEYEEYFFTDWDCPVDLNLGEYVNIEDVNELAETLEDMDEDLAGAILEIWGKDALEDADDMMILSDVNTDYDLGYYWIEESGCYDTKALGNLANYIDYEAFGRDCRMEADGGFTDYGWIQRM